MICIIPARGGSQRIPGKNKKRFCGKPIIQYSIDTAILSSLFDYIYVSTDDDEIMSLVNSYGYDNLTPIIREPELCADEVGTQEVMREELSRISHMHSIDHWACCLYATAPLITAGDLQWGFRYLVSDGRPYVISSTADGKDVGGFYFGYTHAFLTGIPVNDDEGNVIESNALCLEVDDIDINTPEDWARAENLYEERYGTK